MTKLWLVSAAVLLSVTTASAQKAGEIDRSGGGNLAVASPSVNQAGRAQDDDERRAQGALGLAKLVQDSSRSESEIRELLNEAADASDDVEGNRSAMRQRDRFNRAAWMRDDR